MGKFSTGVTTSIYRIASDIAVIIVTFILWTIFFGGDFFSTQRIGAVILFMLIYVLCSQGTDLYNITTFYYADRVFWRVTYSFCMAVGGTYIVYYLNGILGEEELFLLTLFGIVYILEFLNVLGARILVRKLAKKYMPRTVLVGEIEQFEKFHRYMSRNIIAINEIGYISLKENPDERYLAGVSQMEQCLQDYYINQVYVLEKNFDDVQIREIINLCIDMGIRINVVHHCSNIDNVHTYIYSHGTYPVVTYHLMSLNKVQGMVKRTMDIVGALAGIILTIPIMLVTAVVIKLTSPGPVIFAQKRIGQNGKPFKMYKFRSMYQDAEERKKELMKYNTISDGLMFKIQDDPRITPVGKFIRKTSIDELPQFFNVLMGDMSLIGTRPPTPDEVSLYQRKYWKRISIKPGITGAWQVSGRSAITDFDRVVELDTEYISNWSIWLDIKIIFKTIKILINRTGAY